MPCAKPLADCRLAFGQAVEVAHGCQVLRRYHGRGSSRRSGLGSPEFAQMLVNPVLREGQQACNVDGPKRGYRKIAFCLVNQRPNSFYHRDRKPPVGASRTTITANFCHLVQRLVSKKFRSLPLTIVRSCTSLPFALNALCGSC